MNGNKVKQGQWREFGWPRALLGRMTTEKWRQILCFLLPSEGGSRAKQVEARTRLSYAVVEKPKPWAAVKKIQHRPMNPQDHVKTDIDETTRSDTDDVEMLNAVQVGALGDVDALLVPAAAALLDGSAESFLTASATLSRASSCVPSAPPSPMPRTASQGSEPSTMSMGPASLRSSPRPVAADAPTPPPINQLKVHPSAHTQMQPPQSPRRLASTSTHSFASNPSHASVPSSSSSKVCATYVDLRLQNRLFFCLPSPIPFHRPFHLQYSQSIRSSSATLDPQADPRYRYQLIQKIGEGGYGSVYRAFDAHTGQTVAVKTIDLEGAALIRPCAVHSFTFDWCCISRPRVSPVGVVGVGDELDEVNQEIAVMSEVRACPWDDFTQSPLTPSFFIVAC